MTQTAVEYLQEHFETLIQEDKKGLYRLLFEQAKEMEKQQIIKTGLDCGSFIETEDMEQYYNETYGSKGSDELSKVAENTSFATSSQTENKGLDWLVSHWKKLQSEGEKMNWEQIIQITELAKEAPSSQTEISVDEIDKAAKQYYEENIDCSNIPRNHYEWEIQELMSDFCYKWYREQLKKKQ